MIIQYKLDKKNLHYDNLKFSDDNSLDLTLILHIDGLLLHVLVLIDTIHS